MPRLLCFVIMIFFFLQASCGVELVKDASELPVAEIKALGIKFYREQNYEEAVKYFLLLVSKDAAKAEHHAYLANANFRMGNLEKAVR